jgi:hypothetical protein
VCVCVYVFCTRHVSRYGPPEDKPWVISHEYELDQGKALEEVRLKRYRRLLGPPIKETTLSYFDRKLWATAIEADCEVRPRTRPADFSPLCPRLNPWVAARDDHASTSRIRMHEMAHVLLLVAHYSLQSCLHKLCPHNHLTAYQCTEESTLCCVTCLRAIYSIHRNQTGSML